MIRIIAVGKKHDRELAAAIASYEKRLRSPFNVEWLIIPSSPGVADSARQDESTRILERLGPTDRVILLDERGEQLSSPELSAQLAGQNASIIIGGAYGVNDAVRTRANLVVSLSKMVFPHQLVRLILIEQLYRAQAIDSGHPYHHV